MNTNYTSLTTMLDDQPTVLFVGDSTDFSDMYLRLIQSEFPDLDVENLPNANEVKEFISSQGTRVCAVVLSCQHARNAISDLQSIAQAVPSIRLVLAYETVEEVRTALYATDKNAFVERLSFLPLRARMDCTITVLRLVLSGERHVSGEVLDMLMAWKTEEDTDQDGHWALTGREKEVLEQLAKGASNKLIARELDLAESTVKLHIHHIIGKLGVSNRTAAAVAYVASLPKTNAASS
jgi:DNA-binding NarL/FixJ family response regulator